MRVKDDFFERGFFEIGNGLTVRFWEDVWLGDTSLAQLFPSLYNIVQRKNVLVANVLANTPLNIDFRRVLTGNKWNNWLHLCQRLMMVQLSDNPDKFIWKLTSTRAFTVRSMYLDLMNGHTRFLRTYLWKLKIPLKIKIFMWFLNNKVVLTKDNLAKQNWHGCTKCCFCDSDETVEHLFISCPSARIVWRMIYFTYTPTNITTMFSNWLNGVDKTDKARIRIGVSALCWSIWTCRNNFVFNKHVGTNFLQVIRMAAHWIQLWSMLLPEDQ
jgi:hypothetical protein